ncbi:MAG: hypothetical protein IT363_00415 [Methanoregulaceae archaeon]|nr:hypothetical protein [Methanoregulaceae archaeon]
MMITIDAPFDIKATTHITAMGALAIELRSERAELIDAVGLLFRKEGTDWCFIGEVRLSGNPVAAQLYNYRSTSLRLEIVQTTIRRCRSTLATDCPEEVSQLALRLGADHPFWGHLLDRFGSAGPEYLCRILRRSHIALRSQAEILALIELKLAREAMPEELRGRDDLVTSTDARIEMAALAIEFTSDLRHDNLCPQQKKSA